MRKPVMRRIDADLLLELAQHRVRFDRGHQLDLQIVQADLLAPFEFALRLLQRVFVVVRDAASAR